MEEKKSFLKAGLVETVIILVLIGVIIGILSYLKIIPLNSLLKPSAGKKPAVTQNADQIQLKTNLTPVKFQCPVDFTNCRNGVAVKYNKQPAVLFTVPKSSAIFSTGSFLSLSSNSGSLGTDTIKTLTAPFIYNDQCYTATYIVPDSSFIDKAVSYPAKKGTAIGTASEKYLTLEKLSFNLLVQLQKRELDPNKGKKDEDRCSNTGLTPDKYGDYVNITALTFD